MLVQQVQLMESAVSTCSALLMAVLLRPCPEELKCVNVSKPLIHSPLICASKSQWPAASLIFAPDQRSRIQKRAIPPAIPMGKIERQSTAHRPFNSTKSANRPILHIHPLSGLTRNVTTNGYLREWDVKENRELIKPKEFSH